MTIRQVDLENHGTEIYKFMLSVPHEIKDIQRVGRTCIVTASLPVPKDFQVVSNHFYAYHPGKSFVDGNNHPTIFVDVPGILIWRIQANLIKGTYTVYSEFSRKDVFCSKHLKTGDYSCVKSLFLKEIKEELEYANQQVSRMESILNSIPTS